MKRILTLLLCAALALSMAVPSLAVQTEQETAAAWLKENGILTGDQSGNLNLESGLTRAELAVILTRLADKARSMDRNATYYRTICPFTDVPDWAMPYAGYCAEKKLMARYGNKQFGPSDPVTPAAACVVMLRYLDCPVGPLPTPTCDWSAFPEAELPAAEAWHFSNANSNSMFIRNLYETRRMQYIHCMSPNSFLQAKAFGCSVSTLPVSKLRNGSRL